ncbi:MULTISPECIES: thiamine phosphate synthase [Rodentibacter]|uniref:thiamine phosphate synthase n=1 Tax=Rodentibacter TaxID=1960084 RepID=UPI001CFD3F65|nr:thiamine phosphate synthase [Rodentibacter sp. JRC1]GJI55809.1 bifunctional hydroxymethylpyrimidine kinase/phosphomethylpyrimidine kinase [Rodentibacter sp. JRC1]
MKTKILWTVAGSDSCAGAGLQTDLHTFRDFEVIGNSIVTSVTAQHPKGVLCVTPVDDDTFRQQFEALLVQGYPDGIKIGLLCNANQVQILAKYIAQIRANSPKPLVVVYDPVAVASSGQTLSDSVSLPLVQAVLYPQIDLITPNGTELELLSGVSVENESAVISACKILLKQGIKAVLAKGGHFIWQGEIVVDYLVTPKETYHFRHSRLESINSHGTGCTYASACCAMLARGFSLEDAITVATAYLQQGLAEKTSRGQTALCSLKHLGYPNRLSIFPDTVLASAPLTPSEKTFAKTELKLGLYPVVDSLEWIERLISAGVKTMQLRLKNLTAEQAEPLIMQAVELGKKFAVRLFINDFWRLAIKHQAYGVHLGQEDLATADLNAIANAGLRLGVSTHGYFEIMRVLPLRPSYIALGHIFPTQTKQMPSQPQGLANLARYAELLNDTPLVAIGGIKAEHFSPIRTLGVGSIAVVTAITQAENWRNAVNHLQGLMEQKC